jgi:hypothetical protein
MITLTIVLGCGNENQGSAPQHEDGGSEGGGSTDAGRQPGDGRDSGSGDDQTDDGGTGDGDAGSVTLESCLARAPAHETTTQRILLEVEDLSVGLVRHVDPDGVSTAGTTVWILDAFALKSELGVVCVSDPKALSYTISHHNYDDKAEVTADGATYLVELMGAPSRFTLSERRGDKVVLGPVDLTLQRCTTLNDGSQCVLEAGP